MAVLSRFNYLGQQRLDDYMLLADQSFTAADFRALIKSFAGPNDNFVLRGLEVVGTTGTSIDVALADSIIFNPLDGSGSFYYGSSSLSNSTITLPANQTNIFVEAKFEVTTGSPVSAGFWDPLALSGTTEGTEFSAPSDTEKFIQLNISYNTIGFTAGSMPLFRVSTTTTVSNITDCRPLFFRLGTGGSSPNPLAKFNWSTSRGEPVLTGPGVADNASSTFRAKDSSGIINDKGIQSMKEWMDAIMTRLCEIAGVSLWYQSGSAVSPASNISLNQLFFDTIGHSIEASDNASMRWQKTGSVYNLIGHGTLAGSAPFENGLIRWKSNYNNIEWHLSNAFNSSSDRRYATLRWTSPNIADGDNLYLSLEREVTKGSGSNVTWKPSSPIAGTGWSVGETVQGVSGDFTGIAVGDFIRKESEGLAFYYKVTGLWNGSVVNAVNGSVADSTIVAVRVGGGYDFTSPIPSTSIEPLKYFRSRYSSADLVVGQSGQFADANLYWLGRRKGSLFFLKDYGNMQDGEEVVTVDGHLSEGYRGGAGDLIVNKENNTFFSSGSLQLLGGGGGSRITIRRYKRDDTAAFPGPSDNSGSYLTYTINADIPGFVDGESLWVRLSDTTSGALTAASVTNTTDDENNTDVNTNRYERRAASNAPTRTFDNKDVFLLARATTINGVLCLSFIDGSVLGPNGEWIRNTLQVQDNIVITDDSIDVLSPVEFDLLTNVGQNQINIGSSASTVYIPGDLVVDGTSSSLNTNNLTVDDKTITLGVGNLTNGETGSGIDVAGATVTSTNVSTTNTSPIASLTVTTTSFTVGTVIGVSATQDVGGITSGAMSGEYTVIGVPPTSAGQAYVPASGTLQIYTTQTASSTTSSSTTPPRVFYKKYSFRVANKDTDYTGLPTSLLFDWNGAKVYLHPLNTTYSTLPVAHTTNFLATRIPFVNDDNNGTGGVDTTLNFSNNFRYDDATNSLFVSGDTPFVGRVVSDLFVGQHQPSAPTVLAAGYTNLWASSDFNLYQRTPDGNISQILKGESFYKEEVEIVAVPSGNNQAAPISSPPTTITIPKDTKKHLGTGLIATTSSGSATVIVNKQNHGLTSGELVTVTTSNAIGGISGANLSVTNASLIVLTPHTFSYSALASATSNDTGFLDATRAVSARSYVAGSDDLEIILNGQVMIKGDDYNEVGAFGTLSTSVEWLRTLTLTDNIIYSIKGNAGLVIIQGGGGSDLQTAYNNGEIINITPSTPIQLLGTGTLLYIQSDLQIDGVIL